ncbi:hypothetical protein [Mesobacillus maritimus]|uniref:hypothetical protein n=1 Tax=Mesobacillus maritimus TaxID=1643336 RepID=UPI00384F6FCE
MFDPTAFDNMKVVVEGAIYDRDLDGELLVTNREDLVDLANLSRTFKLAFSLTQSNRSNLHAELKIQAGLKNLAAEILEMGDSSTSAGCVVTVAFHLTHANDEKIFFNIQKVLEEIWGGERKIEQVVKINPIKKTVTIVNEATVQFNRLVVEDQIGDLTDMIDYIVLTLKELEGVVR